MEAEIGEESERKVCGEEAGGGGCEQDGSDRAASAFWGERHLARERLLGRRRGFGADRKRRVARTRREGAEAVGPASPVRLGGR
eukprot:73252-Prorocentrum_minimum.AAC.2